MDLVTLLIPLFLVCRVFSSKVPYAGAPTKAKILHVLALLFLFACFFDVPRVLVWLIRWPSHTLGLYYVAVGFFRPPLSLLAFICHLAAGIFTLYCTFEMAWGRDRWRRRFLSILPVIAGVLVVDSIKGAVKTQASHLALGLTCVGFVSLLALVYLFYRGAYSRALFPRHESKSA